MVKRKTDDHITREDVQKEDVKNEDMKKEDDTQTMASNVKIDTDASLQPPPETTKRDFHGSCACGNVKLVVPKGTTILFSGYCHCKSCQKMTSCPVTSSFGINPDDVPDFSTTEETNLLGFTQITKEGGRRFFCKTCSIYLYSYQDGSLGVNHIPFDALTDIPPTSHWYYSNKIFPIVDGLPKYKEWPPMGPGMPCEVMED
jgi:hypothetical protein